MKTYRLATAAIAVLVAAIGQADIAYNNFGSGDSYDANNWWPTGGDHDYYFQAASFISGSSGSILSIKTELLANSSYFLYIDADANGKPGEPLEMWIVDTDSGSPDVLVHGDGRASLTAGTRYWFEVAPGGTDGGWYASNSDSGMRAQSDGGKEWDTYTGRLGVFRVETEAVPEAAPVVSLALGMAAAMVRTRKRMLPPWQR